MSRRQNSSDAPVMTGYTCCKNRPGGGRQAVNKRGACLKLSDNQKKFFVDALASGHDVDFIYCERYKYARKFPAVYVDDYRLFTTRAGVCVDMVGQEYVVYALF